MRYGEGRRGLWAAVVGLMSLLCMAAPAAAIDLNGIKITPSFAYKGEYDDNVFRTQFEKRSDYINYFTPGIKFEANPGRHNLSAEFWMDVLRFSNHNDLDTERYYGNLLGNWKFNRLETWLKEGFRWTDDFPSNELQQRIRRFENNLDGGFDYDVVPQVWGLGLDVAWNNLNYLESGFDFLDENQFVYAANAYYRMTGKSRAFLEYAFVDEDFKNSSIRNDTRHRVQVGVRGDLAERFSMTGKAGWEFTNFHDGGLQDQNNFIASIDATYQAMERLAINLLLKRDVPPSTFGNNAVYAEFSTILTLAYKLTPKVTIGPRGFFGVDNYKEQVPGTSEKRLDYLYGGGLGVRYEVLKWLRLDANYDYTGRNSNFNTFDYDDNRVNLSITLSM